MSQESNEFITAGEAGEFLQWAESTGIADLSGIATDSDWPERLREGIAAAARNPALLHGLRVQNMFAAMLPSLGEVTLLKQEDTGPPIFSNRTMTPPDFRVILNSGVQYLIEVKSHYTKLNLPTKSFQLRRKDFEAYKDYSSMVGSQLLIAVYWGALGLWSLVDPDSFALTKHKARLDFGTAMKRNRMSELGDRWLWMDYPLSFVLKAQDGTVEQQNRKVSFVVDSVDYYCAGRKLRTDSDRRLANFLMFWGKWELNSQEPNDPDSEFKGVEYVFEPEIKPESSSYAGIGTWSEMLSRQFTYQTARDGDVERLLVSKPLSQVSRMLPESAESSNLGLRIMYLNPS